MKECTCNMSIQQSVNNMLATAAVVGGVAKHGIEEEAKNKSQAINNYFGEKEKLLTLQAEQENNQPAFNDYKDKVNSLENEKTTAVQAISDAEKDELRASQEYADFITSTPAPQGIAGESEEAMDYNGEVNERQQEITDAQERQKKGKEQVENLNKELEKIKSVNKSLESLMHANQAAQTGVKAHMDAIKSGRYKKYIEELEGGKK